MRNENIIPLEVYSDGSCKKLGKQTFGGWAYIICRDGKTLATNTGSCIDTTNQRMELLSALEAIKMAERVKRPNEKVVVYSDSAYFINCYQKQWYETWRLNGWVNSQKKEVANIDLWSEIVPFFDRIDYDFQKVKGHANDVFNNKCDTLAQYSADREKLKWRGTNNVE